MHTFSSITLPLTYQPYDVYPFTRGVKETSKGQKEEKKCPVSNGARWPDQWRRFCVQAPPVTAQVRFVYCERKRREQESAPPPSLTITIPYSSNLPQGSGSQGHFLLQYMSAPVPLFPEFDYFFFPKDYGSWITRTQVHHYYSVKTIPASQIRKKLNQNIIIIYRVQYSYCATILLVQLYPRRLPGLLFYFYYGMFYALAEMVGRFSKTPFWVIASRAFDFYSIRFYSIMRGGGGDSEGRRSRDPFITIHTAVLHFVCSWRA
jgi:hypothetical protein